MINLLRRLFPYQSSPCGWAWETMSAELETAVYRAVLDIYEDKAFSGLIRGNTHHAAQKIARKAVEDLEDRWEGARY